ncbi:hypothetical protein [Priestia megaterium]|uniref:hypothetical protein n=1 Tax=Priestia megaterium TaxID=1404 RepID=UPI002FFE2080
MKLSISHDNKHIFFKNEDSSFIGETDYTTEIWSEISKLNWYVSDKKLKEGKKTYIYTGSKKFDGYSDLHQIVMILWYGLEIFKKAYEKEFIVEHHDNNAFNCLIRNLSFASKAANLAKAHTYDKERLTALPSFAINIFKDFDTQKYQITVGLTKDFEFIMMDGTEKSLTALHLIYLDDFRLVFQDASNFVYNLLEYEKFDLRKLQCIEAHETESVFIYSTDGKEIPPLVEMDGQHFLVLNEKTRLTFLPPKEELYKPKGDS